MSDVELEVDGQAVSVPAGSTVMDAARKMGHYIPHFCYHKKLTIVANCRMCLVEVEKASKPLPACSTPAAVGMKVWTHSEKAKAAQKGVMEFLLINHPLDCPICDQGGECQLQDLAVGYGQSSSGYTELKRVVLNKDLGPLISTDMTRCIHCTRCVRFGQEIAGVMELGMAGRGEHSEILTFMGKAVASELSGNVIDLCPVGALTSKPFRFVARAWEMTRYPGISPHDGLGSNLQLQVFQNHVKRVVPLENEEINECWISDRDRFSYEGMVSADRLLTSYIRNGRQWDSVDRQFALARAAKSLKDVVARHGTESVGFIASPSSTMEELYLFSRLARGLGCENVDFRVRVRDARIENHRRGLPWLGMPIAKINEVDHALVVGGFLRQDQPLLAQRLRQRAARGAQLNFIDAAGEDPLMETWTQWNIAPSAHSRALAEVANALAALQGSAKPYAVGETSTQAQRIAQSLSKSQQGLILLTHQASEAENAASIFFLAQTIATLCGARVGVLEPGANALGARVAGCLPRKNGLSAMQMVSEPRKAYVMLNCEPELDFILAPQALAAMKQAELVIQFSAFLGQIEDYAHVAIPVATFAEISGTTINMEGRVQSFQAAVTPPGEAAPGWKILRVMGNLLELPGFEYADVAQVRDECLAARTRQENGATYIEGVDNAMAEFEPVFDTAPQGNLLERVAPLPQYEVDCLVRRAKSLQRARPDAGRAYLSSATMTRFKLESGQKATFQSKEQMVSLEVAVEDRLPDNCVRIATSHAKTWMLGGASSLKIGEG